MALATWPCAVFHLTVPSAICRRMAAALRLTRDAVDFRTRMQSGKCR